MRLVLLLLLSMGSVGHAFQKTEALALLNVLDRCLVLEVTHTENLYVHAQREASGKLVYYWFGQDKTYKIVREGDTGLRISTLAQPAPAQLRTQLRTASPNFKSTPVGLPVLNYLNGILKVQNPTAADELYASVRKRMEVLSKSSAEFTEVENFKLLGDRSIRSAMHGVECKQAWLSLPENRGDDEITHTAPQAAPHVNN